AIRSNHQAGFQAFSNMVCFTVQAPNPPAVHYLRVATVSQNEVELRHQISTGSNVKAIRFEKLNLSTDDIELLVELPADNNLLSYVDTDVDVANYSYTYRAIVVDSCDGLRLISNNAKTILLKVTTDQTRLTMYLNWSTYGDYDGGVL